MSSPKQAEERTADTPLDSIEIQFVNNYIACSNFAEAVSRIPGYENRARNTLSQIGQKLFARPNVRAAIDGILAQMQSDTVANAQEVMAYFTSVMRGEVKDQFGLEASLSERTRAAQELAKRTIDIENRKAGEADQVIEINLNWQRKKEG